MSNTIDSPVQPFKSKFVLKLKDFKKIQFNQTNSKEGLDEMEVEMNSFVRNPKMNPGFEKGQKCAGQLCNCLPTASALLENSIGALKDLHAEIIRVGKALENQSMENILRPLIDSTILISQQNQTILFQQSRLIDSIAQQEKDLAELKLISKMNKTVSPIQPALVKNHDNQVQNEIAVDIINPFAEPFPHRKITNNHGQEKLLATRLQSIFTIPPPRRPRQVSPAPNIDADLEAKNTMRIRAISGIISRNASSSSGDKRHPPEFLEVAKNWPHEEYSPEHYTTPLSRPEHHSKESTHKDIQVAASTNHHHHEEEPEPISFNTPAWHKALGVVAISLLAWRISQEYSSESHPISNFLATLQSLNTAEQAVKADKESIPLRLQQSHDTLILNSKHISSSNYIPRWTIPLDRASDFLVPVGSQVDGVGEGRIYSWQEHDDIDKMTE